jgi:hypothetical protein
MQSSKISMSVLRGIVARLKPRALVGAGRLGGDKAVEAVN